MSCSKCTEAQREAGYDKDGQATVDPKEIVGDIQPMPIHYTYVRVGNGNVLISGCREHMQELLDKLRRANNGN